MERQGEVLDVPAPALPVSPAQPPDVNKRVLEMPQSPSDCNLVRNLQPEPSNGAAVEFLAY